MRRNFLTFRCQLLNRSKNQLRNQPAPWHASPQALPAPSSVASRVPWTLPFALGGAGLSALIMWARSHRWGHWLLSWAAALRPHRYLRAGPADVPPGWMCGFQSCFSSFGSILISALIFAWGENTHFSPSLKVRNKQHDTLLKSEVSVSFPFSNINGFLCNVNWIFPVSFTFKLFIHICFAFIWLLDQNLFFHHCMLMVLSRNT